MRLSDHLRDDLVLHGLEASNREQALRAISRFLEERGAVDSAEEVLQVLSAREEAHTTALGDGVALPHAVLPKLADRLIMVAAAAAPLPYGPETEDPVDIFFVLLSPPGREGEHIKLLARICRLARQPGFLEEMRRAPGPKELFETVVQEDARHV